MMTSCVLHLPTESTDDDAIVTYLWEQVTGPLGSEQPADDVMAKSMLVLKALPPGDYKFKYVTHAYSVVANAKLHFVLIGDECAYGQRCWVVRRLRT